jgi:hypothetical protein
MNTNAMTRRLAWILSAAGLLPFIGHALFAWVAPGSEAAGLMRSQAHYAAAILTFVGALHWGMVVAGGEAFAAGAGVRLVWSVIPALYAWVMTLYPPAVAVPGLFFGLLVALLVDLLLYRSQPGLRWFMQLRLVISLVAVACVGASWVAISVRLTP